ncbi:hypothetical protein ASPNIDRAFT_37507 [Aspergillus niger ATCC 1015]|uniref:Uncharacterized protein n=1 Tax=Aspergillus niger (strain ATCC 1015 / CBS 113.46 / FGSC A1144 / LSHB Ac4 / NCTC 3858a / NRRL 328 / USDA 3528.7) TaxID=380704 RepID=G3Y2E8_ASPNA|nr:hypothetical protein ASPNIDRAFT_37507 [Aspergillus niger ATCC 1015]
MAQVGSLIQDYEGKRRRPDLNQTIHGSVLEDFPSLHLHTWTGPRHGRPAFPPFRLAEIHSEKKVQCGPYPFPTGRRIRHAALRCKMWVSSAARLEAWKAPDERQHAAEHMPNRNLGGKHVDPGWQGPSYGRVGHYMNASSSILAWIRILRTFISQTSLAYAVHASSCI